MTNIEIKNKMKIAMVGVSPADQITFKGYLRVLLRLDVDLDWVSAQVGEVDLYVINQDFKNSTSVQKLMEAHPSIPILYVSRNLTGEGSISGDSLVLPLKQINALNDWLHDKVGVLKGIPHQKSANTILDSQPESKAQNSQLQNAQTQATQAVQSKSVDTSLNDVVELIKTLNNRPKSLFELVQDGEVLAVIDGTRQLVWLKSAKMADITAWRLRVYGGIAGEPKQAIDMNQWLYQMAWANAEKLLPLIDGGAHYQLRSWAKPDNNADRRMLLRAMVALEDKARTVDEVVALTGLSRPMIQKIIASLLFSQHLSTDCYKNINFSQVAAIKKSIEATHLDATPPKELAPTPKTAEQEEKIGFLARLRRKLGL